MVKERLWLEGYKEEINHIHNYFPQYGWELTKDNRYSYKLSTITTEDITINIYLLDWVNGFTVISEVSKEFTCKVIKTQHYVSSANYDPTKPINNKETITLKDYGFSNLSNNFSYNIHVSFPKITKMLDEIELIGKSHIIFL